VLSFKLTKGDIIAENDCLNPHFFDFLHFLLDEEDDDGDEHDEPDEEHLTKDAGNDIVCVFPLSESVEELILF
jgi:hypothetical protein